MISFAQSNVPFTGKRDFNILEGYSGTGTPAYHVDIKKNGDVYFGLYQINQASGEETKEDMYAGKYNPKVMKVHFKTFNETFYVRLEKEKIYLTDEKGTILKLEDCCSVSEIDKGSCICDSALYK